MEVHSMRLTLDYRGDWIVDPRELAERLGVSTAYLRRMEQQGHVDARIRASADEEPGHTRVTVRLLNKGWRGVFDQSGTLLSEDAW
jgi:hypothetical protein